MSEEEKKAAAFSRFFGRVSSGGASIEFRQLSCGTTLFRTLAKVAPAFFTDESVKIQQDSEEGGNWVVRKSNLDALLQDMSAYGQRALSASHDFDVSRLIDAELAARALDGEDQGAIPLLHLCELVFVMAVLSGNPEVIGIIKSLPREDQGVLNQAAKRCMGLYSLKPAKKGAVPSSSTSGGAATPTSGHANEWSPVASAADSDRISHRTIGGLPAATPTSAEAAVSQRETAELRSELLQLRAELSERSNELHQQRTRAELLERERETVQKGYEQLLEETEKLRTSSSSEKHMLQTITLKEEAIRQLTSALADLSSKLSASKDRVGVLEGDLEAAVQRASAAESELRQRQEEKSEHARQYTLLQDRYDIAVRSKKEQSDEINALRMKIEELEAERLSAQIAQTRQSHHDDDVSEPGISGGDRRSRALELGDEDDVAALKDQLATALMELRLYKANHGSNSGAAVLGSTVDESGTTPERRMDTTLLNESSLGGHSLSSALFAAQHGEEGVRLPSNPRREQRVDDEELATLRRELHEKAATVEQLERKTSSLQSHLQRSIGELESVKESKDLLEQQVVELRDLLTDAQVQLQATLDRVAAAKPSADIVREVDALRKQVAELNARIVERAEATRKEQAILVSTVVKYGHRNLLLQQRQLLSSSSAGGAPVTAAQPTSGSKYTTSSAPPPLDAAAIGGGGGGALSSWNSWLLSSPNQDTTEIPGSFLTKHRRALERGLLDSLLTAPPAMPSTMQRR